MTVAVMTGTVWRCTAVAVSGSVKLFTAPSEARCAGSGGSWAYDGLAAVCGPGETRGRAWPRAVVSVVAVAVGAAEVGEATVASGATAASARAGNEDGSLAR